MGTGDLVMNQISKKVEAEYLIYSEKDNINIEYANGFIRAINHSHSKILLSCDYNKSANDFPIPVYKVKIIIEALTEEEYKQA
jgi:hypothetical protein